MKLFSSILSKIRSAAPKLGELIDDRLFLKSRHSCPACKEPVDDASLIRNLYVCPFCDYHFRLNALERMQIIFDPGSYKKELFANIQTANPIDFPDYEKKILQAKESSGLNEAVSAAAGKVGDFPLLVIAMSFQFMGGSMGSVVGEKITRCLLWAMEEKMPCLICTASGGARMQEGTYSLMQMAKTSHAIALFKEACLPLFVLLTDPTTGGVTASFSMLGDVTLAEPQALIGFAGPRVIEGTIKQKLPQGFQRTEFLQEKGFVDIITPRQKLRKTLMFLLESHTGHAGKLKKYTGIFRRPHGTNV